MHPPPIVLPAPAKINLTLDVFSRRSDGYHGIASVMQTISVFDTLEFQAIERPGVEFTCAGRQSAGAPHDHTNLVVRAAKELLDRSGRIDLGISIILNKELPAQAGLGGGSSDAATALLGVNAALRLGLPFSALTETAASLGSDVAFFLTGGTAVARGRGEDVTPVQDLPTEWVVVVKPAESVSTGMAYAALDSLPDRASHRATSRFEKAMADCDRDRIMEFQCNDFESVVLDQCPAIAWLMDELRMAGARTARLCGSGAAVYGMFENEQRARRALPLFADRFPWAAAARFLPRAECAAAFAGTGAAE